jgi:hypothetical protein
MSVRAHHPFTFPRILQDDRPTASAERASPRHRPLCSRAAGGTTPSARLALVDAHPVNPRQPGHLTRPRSCQPTLRGTPHPSLDSYWKEYANDYQNAFLLSGQSLACRLLREHEMRHQLGQVAHAHHRARGQAIAAVRIPPNMS